FSNVPSCHEGDHTKDSDEDASSNKKYSTKKKPPSKKLVYEEVDHTKGSNNDYVSPNNRRSPIVGPF
ncbi:hypothetical protein, partial [Vibrio cholerae]|uniref:hypothetical protein n=1 Tax=Vibrio cholerae TaxID=666 RepID=UPI001F3E716A